jgi:hypothetical protein
MNSNPNKEIEVKGVKNIQGELCWPLNPSTKMGSFEVRLEFPDCELTKTLRHKDIDAVLRYDRVFIYMYADDQTTVLKEGVDDETLRDMLDNKNVTMNLTVVYHPYGNVRVQEAILLSADDR